MTARQAASGRRAHQMCNVEIWPCRIDFSRRACTEIRLIGRSTSIRRLQYFVGSVMGRAEDLLRADQVVFDLHDRFPPEERWILNGVELR